MTGLAAVFERTGRRGGSVLVGYLPAGFPSFGGCIAALTAMVAAGVEVVEVGLPYSDPTLDGPVIAGAAGQALRSGIRTRDVLRTVEAVADTGVATVAMSYWNPVERYGVPAFARDLAGAGAAGLITPDLIPDEADEWLAASDQHRLDRVFLVAPASSDARIKVAASACRGFVYAASVTGVTGVRERTGQLAPELVARVRAQADIPVGVGLDMSTPEQIADVASYADGVIVGSAFVRRLRDAPDEATGVERVRALAATLVRAAG
ncbi:MAG TPA: tryptophan synthase subunit alpha [Mycobacteriales bacterium]|nr:tryptophan synthase subunit alpha [Mycobacteriales bacterium]